jgi:uncharacterized protein
MTKVRGPMICLGVILVVLLGCAPGISKKEFVEPLMGDLRAQNYQSVVTRIESARHEGKYRGHENLIYLLESGVAYHYANALDSSIDRLRAADKLADDLYTRSISQGVASMVTNENAVDYVGEDYELIYINVYNALNYLALNGAEDAAVELRRANEKLGLLAQRYGALAGKLNDQAASGESSAQVSYSVREVNYSDDALVRYLSMHMYASQSKWDDAEIDRSALSAAVSGQPNLYPFPIPTVKYRSDGQAILSLVAFTGMGPTKEALKLRVRTDKQLGLVQIYYQNDKSDKALYDQFSMPIDKDYFFKFVLPILKPNPSRVSQVRILSNGVTLGEAQVIEDVSKIAAETYERKKSYLYLRAFTRALAKGLVAEKGKSELDNKGLLGWFGKVLIDAVVDVSEQPDLRCVRLLPDKIWVADFEIQPGTYDLVAQFMDASGFVLAERQMPGVKVNLNGFNLAQCETTN